MSTRLAELFCTSGKMYACARRYGMYEHITRVGIYIH
jgi:hypothetical protein